MYKLSEFYPQRRQIVAARRQWAHHEGLNRVHPVKRRISLMDGNRSYGICVRGFPGAHPGTPLSGCQRG